MNEGSRKAILAAALANSGLAVAKFVAYLATGASSMLAESVHSLADTANQGLLVYGAHRAKRAPTPQHPFGYGRERYFWAFVVALVLFSMGAVFAAYEGIEKLSHPEPLSAPGWAFGVLLAGIVFEALSLRTAVRESQAARGGDSWWRFIRRSRSPELPVILLEDVGALVGLVFALVGVSLSVLTGDARFDGYASIAIGGLLATIAVVMAVEMQSLLVGESANRETLAKIDSVLREHGGIRHVIHMKTLHLGPDELLVAAKVEFERALSGPELGLAIDAAEDALRAAVPIARVVYLEPDVYRDPPAPPA